MSPDPSGASFPGVTYPATPATSASCSSATGSCWRCTRWPAWPASWRARRCRRWPRATAGCGGASTSWPGPLAIAFVAAATLFSLATQAYALGHGASNLAQELDVSPFTLLIGLLPHALPELFALFLPLAAWTLASRAGRWEELLAATFVTTAIAVPILLLAGAVEVWVSPS